MWEKLDAVPGVCDASAPRVRWEAENEELLGFVGQLSWSVLQPQTQEKPCLNMVAGQNWLLKVVL